MGMMERLQGIARYYKEGRKGSNIQNSNVLKTLCLGLKQGYVGNVKRRQKLIALRITYAINVEIKKDTKEKDRVEPVHALPTE